MRTSLFLVTSSFVLISLFLRASTAVMQEKLFVFGDSYVDTGNNRKDIARSWMKPYGITFPGHPSGRYSDGRVFSDFFARSIGLQTPVAFKLRKSVPKQKLQHGINFAFGGSGVFDTLAPYPNMTTQIDFFKHLLNDNVFSASDAHSYVALITLSGNDYAAFSAAGGTVQGLQTFIPRVVNQLLVNIKRVYNLGVRKIAVTLLQPLGCLPTATAVNGFLQCNSTYNQAFSFHNLLLQQGIATINNQTRVGQRDPIIIVDLFTAFLTVFQQTNPTTGKPLFKSPLKPCCVGVNLNSTCGTLDTNGNKLYTVCRLRKSAFFWDSVHPTQAGWNAVSVTLQPTLQKLRST